MRAFKVLRGVGVAACVALTLAVLALVGSIWAAQANAFVYWDNYRASTIGRSSLNGSEVNQSFITTASGGPNAVAVDASHIYWTNDLPSDTVGRSNLEGDEVNQTFIHT